MNRSTQGFTLIELLVAIAIIGIVFYLLANSQLANLRVTAQSRASTELKAVAVSQLETLSRDILQVNAGATGTYDKYAFARYYDRCRATPVLTSPVLSCQGIDAARGLSWTIVSEADSSTDPVVRMQSEGQILLSVTAIDSKGLSYTIIDRLSCYDIYPSPTTTAPAPCPDAVGPGGV